MDKAIYRSIESKGYSSPPHNFRSLSGKPERRAALGSLGCRYPNVPRCTDRTRFAGRLRIFNFMKIKPEQQAAIPKVIQLVCDYYDVKKSEVLSQERGNYIVSDARAVIVHLLYHMLNLTGVNAAAAVKRKQNTCVHCLGIVSDKRCVDSSFKQQIEFLESETNKILAKQTTP